MNTPTAPPEVDRRGYELAGIGIEVVCAAPAAAEAIDFRLRACRARSPRSPDVRLEFGIVASDSPSPSERQVLPGRPVYETPGGAIVYHVDDDALSAWIEGVRMRCEPTNGRLAIDTARYAGRPLYVASHPLATIGLIELLKRRQRFSLHAACLARDGRGVLLAGPSGAGKSTLALALAHRGLAFLADDMVFLTTAPGPIRVLGFADAVGVSDHAIACLPELRGLLGGPHTPGFPKRLVRVEDLFAVSLAADCTPVALVFPEVVAHGPSRLVPLDPAEAWLRLVPDVLVTEAAATQAHLATLAALLERVTCHQLASGPELDSSAELVAALLEAGSH